MTGGRHGKEAGRARIAVLQCISAGQPTGPRTIAQLLLVKNVIDKNFSRATSVTTHKFIEATSLDSIPNSKFFGRDKLLVKPKTLRI